jgi:hypothetical protein
MFMLARHGLMADKLLNIEYEQNSGLWFSELELIACSRFGFQDWAGLNVDFPTFRQTLQWPSVTAIQELLNTSSSH